MDDKKLRKHIAYMLHTRISTRNIHDSYYVIVSHPQKRTADLVEVIYHIVYVSTYVIRTRVLFLRFELAWLAGLSWMET